MIHSAQDELYPQPINFPDFVSKENKKVSIRVRQLRNDRNITLLDINEKIALSFSFEKDGYSCEVLVKLSDFFQVSIDYLVERTDNPKINK